MGTELVITLDADTLLHPQARHADRPGSLQLYRTQALLEAGGWPDATGEDIVLTWQLMRQGARVHYEPSAVAFTAAPARLVHLARQRARWARA